MPPSAYSATLTDTLVTLSWSPVSGAIGSPRRTDLTGSTFVYQNLDTLRATGTIVAEDYVPVEEASRLVRTVSGVYWQSFYDSQANLEAKMRLGRGDSAVRTLGFKQVATQRFAEIVPRVRELIAGREVATDDAAIRLRWATGERVPIAVACWISAWSPIMESWPMM